MVSSEVADDDKRDRKSRSRRKKYKRRSRTRNDSDSSDGSDSDAAPKEIVPLENYINKRRDEMISQMFSCLRTSTIQAMMPPQLKNMSMSELKELCVVELMGMSKKRIRCVLEGKVMTSSSGTEEDSDEEEEEEEHNDESSQAAAAEEVKQEEKEVVTEEGMDGAKARPKPPPVRKDQIQMFADHIEEEERLQDELSAIPTNALIPMDEKKKGGQPFIKAKLYDDEGNQVESGDDGAGAEKMKAKQSKQDLEMLELEIRARAIRRMLERQGQEAMNVDALKKAELEMQKQKEERLAKARAEAQEESEMKEESEDVDIKMEGDETKNKEINDDMKIVEEKPEVKEEEEEDVKEENTAMMETDQQRDNKGPRKYRQRQSSTEDEDDDDASKDDLMQQLHDIQKQLQEEDKVQSELEEGEVDEEEPQLEQTEQQVAEDQQDKKSKKKKRKHHRRSRRRRHSRSHSESSRSRSKSPLRPASPPINEEERRRAQEIKEHYEKLKEEKEHAPTQEDEEVAEKIEDLEEGEEGHNLTKEELITFKVNKLGQKITSVERSIGTLQASVFKKAASENDDMNERMMEVQNKADELKVKIYNQKQEIKKEIEEIVGQTGIEDAFLLQEVDRLDNEMVRCKKLYETLTMLRRFYDMRKEEVESAKKKEEEVRKKEEEIEKERLKKEMAEKEEREKIERQKEAERLAKQKQEEEEKAKIEAEEKARIEAEEKAKEMQKLADSLDLEEVSPLEDEDDNTKDSATTEAKKVLDTPESPTEETRDSLTTADETQDSFPGEEPLDEDDVLETMTWGMRWCQSEKVQKVVSQSKILSKLRRRKGMKINIPKREDIEKGASSIPPAVTTSTSVVTSTLTRAKPSLAISRGITIATVSALSSQRPAAAIQQPAVAGSQSTTGVATQPQSSATAQQAGLGASAATLAASQQAALGSSQPAAAFAASQQAALSTSQPKGLAASAAAFAASQQATLSTSQPSGLTASAAAFTASTQASVAVGQSKTNPTSDSQAAAPSISEMMGIAEEFEKDAKDPAKREGNLGESTPAAQNPYSQQQPPPNPYMQPPYPNFLPMANLNQGSNPPPYDPNFYNYYFNQNNPQFNSQFRLPNQQQQPQQLLPPPPPFNFNPNFPGAPQMFGQLPTPSEDVKKEEEKKEGLGIAELLSSNEEQKVDAILGKLDDDLKDDDSDEDELWSKIMG